MGKIQILDTKSDYKSALRCAVYDLLKNKNVALPTETVYGLAGRISNLDAIESIFILKNRPLTDPLIIHIFDKSWIKKVCKINN